MLPEDETASTVEEKAAATAQLEATTEVKAQTQSLEVEDEASTKMQAQTGSLEAKGEGQLEAATESSCRVGGTGTETSEAEEVEAAEEAADAEMAIEATKGATAGNNRQGWQLRKQQ